MRKPMVLVMLLIAFAVVWAVCGSTLLMPDRVPRTTERVEPQSQADVYAPESPLLVSSVRESGDATSPVAKGSASVPEPLDPSASGPLDKAAFERHLIAYIEEHYTGKPSAPTTGTLNSTTAAGDKFINPEGKIPNQAQQDDIEKIIQACTTHAAELDVREEVLCGAALSLAVSAGQYVASEPNPPLDISTKAGFDSLREMQERQSKMLQQGREVLGVRLGREMKDWTCSVLGTVTPNGDGYKTIVYFTASQAPDLFSCRGEMMALRRTLREDLKRYFATIPK